MSVEQAEYQNVATSALKESPLNPRRTFDKKAIEELEKSIRETGKVLTPLLVCPNGSGETFEVLAGARRLRCAIKIGLETVPVRVLEGLTENQKLEITIIENLQRVDVHPLEEAQAYSILMKSQECDVAAIAQKVGMSEKYVYDRLKLLKLAPKATNMFQEGKIEAGHAILLARLEPLEQAEVLKNQGWRIKQGDLSVRDLANHISYRNQQKKWKAEAAAQKKKEAAERKSGKGSKKKSWREQQEEQNKKYEAERAAQDLKRKAERVARVKTVEAILDKVKATLPTGVFRMLAEDFAGKLKESEIPRAVVETLCGAYDHDWAYEDVIRNVKMLANIYGVKPVKPEPVAVQPTKETPALVKAPKSKPRNKKKVLQTSAKSSKGAK